MAREDAMTKMPKWIHVPPCQSYVDYVMHATPLFYGTSDRAIPCATIMSHEALATQWRITRRLSAMILAFSVLLAQSSDTTRFTLRHRHI
jgi:hypothetical protein